MISEINTINTPLDNWGMSKRVSISVIILLIFNIASIVWFSSQLSSDVAALKARPVLTQRVVKLEVLLGEHTKAFNNRVDLDKIDRHELKVVLYKLDDTINRVATEQAKRTSLVYGRRK